MDGEARTIGGLKLVRLLGKGGMSEVYEAEDPRLGSRHAVKLYAYPKEDQDVRRRFEVEGRLLAKLNHPRIVKVTDIGMDEASGRPYFVMDLILDADGNHVSLADISSGDADELMVGRWYDDIREALAYIHGKGVVHRDLKLQNVLIGPDGHAVLTDFGISKIFEPQDGSNTVVDPVQTIVRLQDGKLADTLAAPDTSPESLDEDWRNAVLKSATEHVLTKTALSERDRAVYRAYVVDGRPIEEVSAEFRISRNMVSQIKTRIERRIVAVGRELVAGMERM